MPQVAGSGNGSRWVSAERLASASTSAIGVASPVPRGVVAAIELVP